MSTLQGFNGQTTDEWQQITCVGAQKLRVFCSNAGVTINFGTGQPVPQWESETEPLLPVTGSIIRPFDAVRFMSSLAGKPAQLILTPSVS